MEQRGGAGGNNYTKTESWCKCSANNKQLHLMHKVERSKCLQHLVAPKPTGLCTVQACLFRMNVYHQVVSKLKWYRCIASYWTYAKVLLCKVLLSCRCWKLVSFDSCIITVACNVSQGSNNDNFIFLFTFEQFLSLSAEVGFWWRKQASLGNWLSSMTWHGNLTLKIRPSLIICLVATTWVRVWAG